MGPLLERTACTSHQAVAAMTSTTTTSDEEALSKRLQLRLHADKLPRVGLTKTPPSTFAHVSFVGGPFTKDQPAREWGCTEIIPKCTHPQWTEVLTTDYEYGTELFFFVQVLRHHHNDPDRPTLIGKALFEVSDIMGTATRTKVRRLPDGGSLYAQIEPVREEQAERVIFRFQMRAMELTYRGSMTLWNTAPDTVLEVAKQRVSSTGNSWVTVYRSGPVYNSLVPTWDDAEIDLGSCCHGKTDWPLRISVMICKNSRSDLLGVCETTVDKLMCACLPEEIEQVSEKDLVMTKLNHEDKEVGIVRVIKAQLLSTKEAALEIPKGLTESTHSNVVCEILLPPPPPIETPRMTRPQFKAYLDGGCEIDLCYAIDFTSSNGDPRIPGTLHNQIAGSLNDYEEAIIAIDDALSRFNSAKEYPVWGFGAKFGGVVRHIFQCGTEPAARGVDGVLEAYRSVFHSDLVMSGPTVFVQVMQAAAMRARKYHANMKSCRRYCVLLIVTDGMVDDIAETKRKLHVYSGMPLSFVIVGVGRAEFKGLKALCNEGTRATFVEFRQHQYDPSSMAKAALKDLPRHIVDYMTANGIAPNDDDDDDDDASN